MEVATDLEFYERNDNVDAADDLDFLEHIEYTTRLKTNKNAMLRSKYDVFYSLPVYKKRCRSRLPLSSRWACF